MTVTIEVFSNHSGVNEVSVFLADGSSVADVLKQEGFGTVGGSVAPPPAAVAEAPFVGGYQYPVLQEGVAVDVEVSWVLSPGEVYLQPTDSAAALTALMKQMQAGRPADDDVERITGRRGGGCSSGAGEGDGMPQAPTTTTTSKNDGKGMLLRRRWPLSGLRRRRRCGSFFSRRFSEVREPPLKPAGLLLLLAKGGEEVAHPKWGE
ncbi:hypothetical protein HPB47_013721 [Ixodes persulcatus]|uniref:Uncharacterized protein n=1 Tax=Ixodes persulcatus TaxID=34615 RepID=A0AC60QY25_IXOPE|nr:hypothetical protein HPB47_013721 [Ixodes persulcatus]